jgi:hypothetical protein
MSLNSSSSDFNASLKLAQKYLYRFGGPVFIVLGIVSCLLSLMVFTRKTLRQSTCSVYFIAFNIANLLFIIFSLLSFTLEIGYNIDPALHNLPYCRVRIYFGYLFDCLCPCYLLFASIDRVLVTSRNARTRKRSTHRLAYMSIGINTIIWILIQIHVVFFVNILEVEPGYFYCYIEPGWYAIAISYLSLVKEISIPSSLAVCGIWSLKNIHNMHHNRVIPILSRSGQTVANNLHSTRSRDRQFVLMLSIDIITYILFNFMMPVSLMYEQISQNRERSVTQTYIILLIRNVAIFSVHIPFCVNSYTHLLVSKTFRNEVKKIFS